MKPIAYIAGKITGDPTYREKFARAQEVLEHRGYIVLNPAILPEGMKSRDYMRICMAMLDTADVAFFLPGWMDSKGAQLEKQYCAYVQKTGYIFEEATDGTINF